MPFLAAIPAAAWYFIAQMAITYYMMEQQAQAAKEQADAQTEMAKRNAELQGEMQEKAQDQNLEKAKQISLAEALEREKLSEQKVSQDIQYKEAYGRNVAQLGDFSMTGNTVNRIFGTIDRKLSENKLSIDRDIETLGSNFAFARKNLQTQTDMGVLGTDININAFKSGEHMGVDPQAAWLSTGSQWMSHGADAYRLHKTKG